mgnify:CR=1 FL=1
MRSKYLDDLAWDDGAGHADEQVRPSVMAARLVQGFSAGGEVSTISAFVAEYAVKGRRGFATSFLMVTAAVGLLLGGVVANGLGAIIGTEAMAAWGWRLPFLLAGVLGGLLATWVTFAPCFAWIFLGAPESPTRKELSGFSWLWFCPVARLNGATHALD